MMSDEDYENLLQIVEAEAGTEDHQRPCSGSKRHHEPYQISGVSE